MSPAGWICPKTIGSDERFYMRSCHFFKAPESSGNACKRLAPGGRISGSRSRFTLIELLIVIAVIAILAALLFPALSKVRARASYSSCVSNFKQISYGYTMYRDDHRGVPPSGGIMGWEGANIAIRHVKGYDDKRGGGPEKYGMPSALWRYTGKNKKIWECPSYKGIVQVSYYANLTQLNKIARGREKVWSESRGMHILVSAANINIYREVGSLAVMGENNYREWGYRTGVFKSRLEDAGPCLDPRVFGHESASPCGYDGAQSDLVLAADGTVAVSGAWGKWSSGESVPSLL